MAIKYPKPESIRQELILAQVDDIMVHKQYVMQACHKMARWYVKNGEMKRAIALMGRSFFHDVSKIFPDEFYGMASFADDMEALKNVNVNFPSEGKMVYVRKHWERNPHHPEYWEMCGLGIDKMPESSLVEMCCDWYSRSLQFGNNLVEWFKIKQETRFHFPEQMYRDILKFCTILTQEESEWVFGERESSNEDS